MAQVVLFQAQPRLPSNGALQTVRLAGGGTKAYFQLGYDDWRSGIGSRIRFTTAIGFDKGGPTGGAIPQTAGIRFMSSDKAYFSALSNVVWPGARVIISTGDDEAPAPTYTTLMKGTIADAKTGDGSLTLTMADLSADLDRPVCPNTFLGNGGIEGADAATGRIKRRTFGQVFNVEGRVLDPANNVYEFGDPAYPLSSFDMLKDKGQSGPMTSLAWQGSVLATLNALKVAAAPSGGGVVAPSISCAKWWTIPAGPLTADISFNSGTGNSPAAIAATIAGGFVPEMLFSNISEAAGWVNYPAGVHIDDANETASSVLDRLLLPVFIAWVLKGDGAMTFRRVSFDNPVASLRAETVERETVFPALKTRKLGFQRNYRIHSEGEISAALLTAKDITYADGTPVETLKPLEAGANITEQHTAFAIDGQGPWATEGRPVVAVFGSYPNLVYNGSLRLGYEGWSLGGMSFNITKDGPFFGAGGSGSTLINQSPVFLLSGGTVVTLQASILTAGQTAGRAYARLTYFNSNGAIIGYGATCLAANGQGWLEFSASDTAPAGTATCAVQLVVDLSPVSNNTAFRRIKVAAGSIATPFSDEATNGALFNDGISVRDRQPQEAGANQTETRNAFGINGQGILATKNAAGYFEIDVSSLTSQSSDTTTGSFGGSAGIGTSVGYVPSFGKDQPIKSGGTIYASISCGSSGTANPSLYNSLEILDAANNAVLGSVKIPFHNGGNYLVNYIVMVPNAYGTRTIRWRLAWRGDASGATAIYDPTITVQWKAL